MATTPVSGFGPGRSIEEIRSRILEIAQIEEVPEIIAARLAVSEGICAFEDLRRTRILSNEEIDALQQSIDL